MVKLSDVQKCKSPLDNLQRVSTLLSNYYTIQNKVIRKIYTNHSNSSFRKLELNRPLDAGGVAIA